MPGVDLPDANHLGESAKSDGLSIPRVIHFVWAGERIMPENNLAAVLRWHAANPNFAIKLWYDKEVGPKDTVQLYQETLAKIARREGIRLDMSKFTFNDVTEGKIVNPIMRYELDKLRPNYGAFSDLARYHILRDEGGVYLDSDILPGARSLEASQIFDAVYDRPKLYVDPDSQGEGAVGNDFFMCTPGHPLMEKILILAENHYHARGEVGVYLPELDHEVTSTFTEENPAYAETYLADDPELMARRTIHRTGPHCVRRITDALQYPQSTLPPEAEGLLEMIPSEFRVVQREMGCSWINRPLGKMARNPAIEGIIKTIKFEAEVMGIIRLDDHIDALCAVTKSPKSAVVPQLLRQLDEAVINYSHIRAAQSLGKHSEVEG